MSKRVDHAAIARARAAAKEQVESWTDEQLERSLASDRLAKAWGLELSTARELVLAERLRRHAERAARP